MGSADSSGAFSVKETTTKQQLRLQVVAKLAEAGTDNPAFALFQENGLVNGGFIGPTVKAIVKDQFHRIFFGTGGFWCALPRIWPRIGSLLAPQSLLSSCCQACPCSRRVGALSPGMLLPLHRCWLACVHQRTLMSARRSCSRCWPLLCQHDAASTTIRYTPLQVGG